MAVYSYVAPSLAPPDDDLARDRREIAAFAQEHDLVIEREFAESPGDVYFKTAAGARHFAPLERRRVGQSLLATARHGDQIVIAHPLVSLSQLAALDSTLRRRGVSLRVVPLEHAGLPSTQLSEALRFYVGAERRCRRMRTLESRAALKAEGRPTGSNQLGWKVERRRGNTRLVPDHEERQTMMEIVKHHLNGKGFRQIATLLTKANVRWKRPDRSRRNGFTWEPWGPSRCERAYNAMITILAEEERDKQAAGDSPSEPAADSDADR